MTPPTAAKLSDAARGFIERGPGKLFIGNEWVEAADGRTFETIDPSTGEVITSVAHAGAEDVDRAVKAARASLDGPWSEMPAHARGLAIHRLADLMLANADELAELEALDNGKPVTLARA